MEACRSSYLLCYLSEHTPQESVEKVLKIFAPVIHWTC